MEIEHVYITSNRDDLRFTRCCVASIRRWYPEIPISLLKDDSNGAYSTRELEDAWDVTVFESDRPLPGRAWAKLEPMFGPGRRRCLILDSDIVFLGRVIESLEAVDSDFVVESMGGRPEDRSRDYFDLAALRDLDPDFAFPGYTFNCGQLVATSGILKRADFAPLVEFGETPRKTRPDVFGASDQGILNYVVLKKAQEGELTLARVPFQRWGRSLPGRQVSTRELTTHSPHPYLVHWAGQKAKILRLVPNGYLLRHFEALYYTRIPRGRRTRLRRTARLLWELGNRKQTLYTSRPTHFAIHGTQRD